MAQVEIVHDGVEKPALVNVKVLPHYLGTGWRRADEPAPEPPDVSEDVVDGVDLDVITQTPAAADAEGSDSAGGRDTTTSTEE